jgi:hypothetical protein
MILFTIFCIVVLTVVPTTTQAALVDKTIIEWSRQVRTCDATDNDIGLTGTTKVVYAHNDDQTTLANDDAPIYHGVAPARGSSEIFFGDVVDTKYKDPQESVVAFTTSPITLPAVQTYYHCQGFKYDWGTTKQHGIKITPSINFTNREFPHHVLLQICTTPLTASDLNWKGDCYGGAMPANLAACDQKSLFAGWAVGGGPIVLPPEAGFPLQGVKYYMIQIHYNNPSLKTGVIDSLGMNVTVAPPRQYDAACLELLREYVSILVPPGNSSFAVEGYADHFDVARAAGALPDDSMKIFATFLHMHTLGRQMRVSHFDSKGNYVADIDYNANYDFNFQQTIGIPAYNFPITDKIKFECIYDSTGKSTDTTGGTSTTNEMCQAYLYYYPASPDPLTVFHSYPSLLVYPYAPLKNGVYPTHVVIGAVQSGLGAGNASYHVDTPPPTTPTCSTTHNRTYDSVAAPGTFGTQYLPISSFNPSIYKNSKVLDALGKYKLHWTTTTTNGSNGVIQFAAEVETSGWLGFGISPNGNMVGSDIALGWVDAVAQTVTLTDRKAVAQSQPVIDSNQDIFNIRGYKGKYEQTPPDYGLIYYNIPVSSTPGSTTGTPAGSTTGLGASSTGGTTIYSIVVFIVLLLVVLM